MTLSYLGILSHKLSHDLVSGLFLLSSLDLLSRHLPRTSLKTSFADLLARPLSGMRLLTSSQGIFSGLVSRPPSKTSSRDLPSKSSHDLWHDCSHDIFSGPLMTSVEDRLSRHLLRHSPMIWFEGLPTRSQDLFHNLTMQGHTRDLPSRPLSGIGFASQDIFLGPLSRLLFRTSSQDLFHDLSLVLEGPPLSSSSWDLPQDLL